MPISSQYIPEKSPSGLCDKCTKECAEGEREPIWIPGGGVKLLCTKCKTIIKTYQLDIHIKIKAKNRQEALKKVKKILKEKFPSVKDRNWSLQDVIDGITVY